jgi:nicotinamidase-related amidase
MKVLVVVDMQNDFITGPLGTPEAQAIVPKVVEKIKRYKENGDVVVYTMDTHYPDYLETMEGRKLPIPHCIRLTDGWLIHNDIVELISEVNRHHNVVEKDTFGSQNLPYTINACMHDKYREANGRDYDWKDPSMIEVVGLCTDICVISNVMLLKAHHPEVPIVVDSSCCAGVTPESHQRALEAMKMCHIDIA